MKVKAAVQHRIALDQLFLRGAAGCGSGVAHVVSEERWMYGLPGIGATRLRRKATANGAR